MKKEAPLVVSRRLARQSAMQAIYQWELTKMPEEQVISMYRQVHPLHEDTDKEYFKQLVAGVMRHHERLDSLILPLLANNTYHLGEVEKAIFRIAAYELVFLAEQIEAAIVISEAVMIAKNFTADKSYTFVNAVLDNLRKKLSK